MVGSAATPSPPGGDALTDCGQCLFAKCGPAAESACRRMEMVRLPKKQTVLAQGDDAAAIWAVRSGRVKLERIDHEHKQIVEVLVPGDVFGFSSVAGGSYRATAETLSACELCSCTATTFRRLLSEVPDLGVVLLDHLHGQLRRARGRLTHLSRPRARDRLAAYLHDRFESESSEIVANDLTLRQLGGVLGLAPETVCRAFGQLREAGVIQMTTNEISLVDADALEDMVN